MYVKEEPNWNTDHSMDSVRKCTPSGKTSRFRGDYLPAHSNTSITHLFYALSDEVWENCSEHKNDDSGRIGATTMRTYQPVASINYIQGNCYRAKYRFYEFEVIRINICTSTDVWFQCHSEKLVV